MIFIKRFELLQILIIIQDEIAVMKLKLKMNKTLFKRVNMKQVRIKMQTTQWHRGNVAPCERKTETQLKCRTTNRNYMLLSK